HESSFIAGTNKCFLSLFLCKKNSVKKRRQRTKLGFPITRKWKINPKRVSIRLLDWRKQPLNRKLRRHITSWRCGFIRIRTLMTRRLKRNFNNSKKLFPFLGMKRTEHFMIILVVLMMMFTLVI
ncbi:hypothetical protein RYX36_030998, partial [Vicia faba]